MLLSQTIVILLVARFSFADFKCDELIDSNSSCNELNCAYLENFKEKHEGAKFCRCKTVITDFPIPDNTLTYDLFNKICYKKINLLHKLWINEAQVERIDNAIFGKYPNLVYLNLAQNKIKLDFNHQAQKLTHLDISQNFLTSLKSSVIAPLESLKMFNASYNEIESLDGCFLNVSNLEDIYLNNNKLKHIKATEFDRLSKLRILNLAYNMLSVIDSSLFLISLEELYLNNNRLYSINTPQFVHLPNLVILDVSFNKIKTLGDHHTFNGLKEFRCSNNQLKDVNKNILQRLKELRVFNISHNQVKTIDEDTLTQNKKLNTLDISSNTLNQMTSDNLANLGNLENLKLNNNSLNESVINCESFKNLKMLNILDLSFNEIAKLYNCTFTQLQHLKKLNLAANQLEQLSPEIFKTLNNVEELDLSENRLQELPDGIFDDTNKLEKLNISHNNISSLNLSLFKNNKQLKELHIKYNNIRDLDFNELEDALPFIEIIDFDSVLCNKLPDNYTYFESKMVKAPECKKQKIKAYIFVVLGVTVILIFAVIGVISIFCKFRLKVKNNIQLMSIPSS